MIVGRYPSPREANRREFMTVLGVAVDEGRPFDVVLEPLAKGRMSELNWLLMFAIGPLFLLCFRTRWQNELFRFRLGRVISCLREGQSLTQAISRHLKWWVPRHHREALVHAEVNDHLRATIAILAHKPPPVAISSAHLGYGLMLYAMVAFFLVFIMPKFAMIQAQMLDAPAAPAFAAALTAREFIYVPLWVLILLAVWQRFRWRDRLLVRIPQIRRGWWEDGLQEAADAIAVALDYGQDIGGAIAMAGATCRVPAQRRKLVACAEQIAEGKSWVQTLERCELFDAFSLWILLCAAAGERPQLGFERVAEWSGSEAKRAHRSFARWTRTLGLFACAGAVGLIAVSFFAVLRSIIEHTLAL